MILLRKTVKYNNTVNHERNIFMSRKQKATLEDKFSLV